ncbi:SdiA-regulated domain-containing protein [bacterium SCSIO 12643]|nr:SdiA-regulated domain-containing protein [bacterium SCSIO 12643]
MMQKVIFIVWPVLMAFGCVATKFMYNLDQPDQEMKLSSELNEVSGLEMLSDSAIATIQDEKGNIYFLDIETGKIKDHFDFGKKGDYEGIAHYKNHFYVLRSDGTIFKIKRGKDAKTYEFKDNKDFDFEGLCMDQKNNRLLVACKTHGNKKKRDHFYIYSFSLEDKKYDDKPVFKISKDEVDKDFKPSGISIHPKGHIYILSSYAKKLLVLSRKGEILNRIKLDKSTFHQPEGITFTSKGDLFISNEKNDYTPTLLRFNKNK